MNHTPRAARTMAALTLSVAALTCSVPAAGAQTTETGSLGSLSDLSAAIGAGPGIAGPATAAGLETETNAVRARAGLPALRHDDALQAAAQRWSERMVAERAMRHQGGYFENLSCGWGPLRTSAGAIAPWMAEVPPNDGHKRNVLNTTIQRMGYGVASADGYWCVTLDAL